MNKKKRINLVVLLLALVVSSCSKEITKDKKLTIIPQPNLLTTYQGELTISNELHVVYDQQDLEPLVHNFVLSLNHFSDNQFKLSNNKKHPRIKIALDVNVDTGHEGYILNINKDEVLVKASSKNGLFYGLQSLKQLILFSESNNGNLSLDYCEIKDSPRYKWRGLMLDESRRFFGKEKVMQLIDYMAFQKLNVFHWHLTDGPAWRIEIKQYPKLTTVGALGNYLNPKAPAEFYTQEDIKEIVAYAKQRFVEVIPEIDMPGHAAASNRAYPEYSGGGSVKYPNFTFNPGKEETYTYLTNILKEVSELFHSKYIHIGGDEVHFGNHEWNTDKDVIDLMHTHGLKDLKAVEKYFVQRMSDSLAHLGKNVAAWDEVIESDLDTKSTLVMWWRHDKPYLLEDALAKEFDVVLCPRLPMYFDFMQDINHEYGRPNRKEGSDLKAVYSFPDVASIDANNKHVKGIQANVWTERIPDNKRLDFMVFTRMSGLSESAWSNKVVKNYDSFSRRLKELMTLYDKDAIYYFDPFDKTNHPEPEGAVHIESWDIKRD